MSRWKAIKARQLLAALLRIGWEIAWQKGSHRRLKRPGWPNYSFAFHDNEEVGTALLPQIAKKTGLQPEDL
jgi:predicted RNA binding protein YcfA (HicA-like mRNA interferase family)